MDNCASGAGELTVNFQHGFIRAEAYCCMVCIILGKTHGKFLINILRICRPKSDFHIHTSSIYAIQTNYILKSNILIFCLICAKILNFPNRFLDQAAIFNGKLSWKAHLSKPFSLRNSVIRACIPVLHPADHNSSSVWCFHCLHCIIVDTIVHCLVFFRDKGFGLFIKFTDQAKSSITIVVLKVFWKHILRAYKYNVFSIQGKEIRALPHFSESAIVRKHYGFKLPVKPIFTSIQKNTAACSIRSVIYDHTAVSTILAFPHFRIAKIKGTAVFRHIIYCKDRISHILLIVHSITNCKALCLYVADTSAWLCLPAHTGIHEKLFSIWKSNGASGETSYVIIWHIWSNCCRKIFPVKKVLTYCMPPVHWSPLGIIWIILIK